MFLPGSSQEDAILVQYSPFFSSPMVLIQAFGVDHILSSFQKFYHTGAPHNHPLFAIHLFRSAQEISEDSCFHSAFVILSSSSEIVISF